MGRLLIRIDRHLCVGFGDCVEEAPDAFALDAEGIVVLTEDAERAARERILEACRACPVDALSALDEQGVPLVP